jgi:hypothetical protein
VKKKKKTDEISNQNILKLLTHKMKARFQDNLPVWVKKVTFNCFETLLNQSMAAP